MFPNYKHLSIVYFKKDKYLNFMISSGTDEIAVRNIRNVGKI